MIRASSAISSRRHKKDVANQPGWQCRRGLYLANALVGAVIVLRQRSVRPPPGGASSLATAPARVSKIAAMIISLIDGAERLCDDALVLAALRRAGARDPIYGASVLIAISNAQGDVCRLVQCQGARQLRHVLACLRALGFAERFTLNSPFHYTFAR